MGIKPMFAICKWPPMLQATSPTSSSRGCVNFVAISVGHGHSIAMLFATVPPATSMRPLYPRKQEDAFIHPLSTAPANFLYAKAKDVLIIGIKEEEPLLL